MASALEKKFNTVQGLNFKVSFEHKTLCDLKRSMRLDVKSCMDFIEFSGV
jgi:hypothetical protein